MVQILERLGHSVECPAQLACCGQPAFNSGYWDEARSVAMNVLHGLKDAEVVVIASGSCGAMLKVFYNELFAGTEHAAAAAALATKCYEFSHFLVSKLRVTDLGAAALSGRARSVCRGAGCRHEERGRNKKGELAHRLHQLSAVCLRRRQAV